MGRKNVKNMQKANKICYYFGEGESKGPEKKQKTLYVSLCCLSYLIGSCSGSNILQAFTRSSGETS